RLQSRYESGWVRAATIVTSESEWGLDKVREVAPDIDGRLVEYGVNPSFYDLPWNPDPSHPVILYCGGTDWRKGFDLLFGALTLAPAPRWTCWIAGGGYIPSEQIGMLPPGTEILGNLNWSQLQERMSRAWALVLPTRADTSPNAVKEARVTGMPVITSRHGGQSGYIRDGENGMIVDPLTPEGLRKAMDALLSDYSLTKNMGAARHAEDRDYFRPERTAEGFTAIYRELVNHNLLIFLMKRTWRNLIYSAWDLLWITIDMFCSTRLSLLSLWFQGGRYGKGFHTTGKCSFKLRREGSILLGEGVSLLAGWRSNRAGLTNPVLLETLGEGIIRIGDNSGGSAVVISSRSSVTIGKHVCLGANVRIYDHDFHPLDAQMRRLSRNEQAALVRSEPITIGDDVFVGANTLILKGVTIGDRSIVAAGTVVSRGQYPEDCIIAGNQASLIKKRKPL
ncbi:MAG: glycosyltransferase, partial [Verrucomicrobia bacterium]|nr:glycosyltransferase [Verrucomicrobiota bacterium]